jgi:anaerobic magnesium-protoporphyrin IX monomethyl ester cyclase
MLIEPPTLAKSGSGSYALAALATYVDEVCNVRVWDESAGSLGDAVRTFTPDVVGISSYSVTYSDAIEAMREVRELAPKALRVIGGIHITCLPHSLDEVFDLGVIGDGEEALRAIVSTASLRDLENAPGVCYMHAGELTINPSSNQDVLLPIPLLHKYALRSYQSGSVGFITSRGCPFKCAFCYSPVMRDNVRQYPVRWVADQFEYATKRLKAEFLMLLDDTVCLDIERLHEIADELERRGLSEFKAAVNIRSSVVSEELCRALARLHVVSWNCGFESGSDRVLKEIKGPSASVDKHLELVELSRKYGVTLNGSFMLGIPGETVQDMEHTIGFMEFLYREKLARKYRGGFWTFCATPFPGTSWWGMALRQGKVSNDMEWTMLDIKSFDHHLMLDDTVSEKEWRRVFAKAASIAEKANSTF